MFPSHVAAHLVLMTCMRKTSFNAHADVCHTDAINAKSHVMTHEMMLKVYISKLSYVSSYPVGQDIHF